MSLRKSVTSALMTALLIGGGVAIAPAAHAGSVSTQAATCSFSNSNGYWYAGHYSGMTASPSSTQVTSAGVEAQCLLKYLGIPGLNTDPGTIDGVFGSNSKAATKRFQVWVNDTYNAGIAEDGGVGPQTWPWLRSF
ncbi:peptidoglycan-binding domain-containing protein [Streptomyces sp. NPDC005181]|uniref:peptidoglycan-binding domain-containing protein n=1 Tax=Streptomyces sp. NPDC005181 TaxID=3156869 RepID=UPI0033A2B187